MRTSTITHFMIALVAFLASLGGYWFWLSEIQREEESVHALEAQIAAKTELHARSGSARAALSKIEAEETALLSHFVSAEEIVSFLESLEKLGEELDARVAVLSVTDPDASGKITLSLSVSGPFDEVMRTIGVIEHGAHASAVRTLSLDASEEGRWEASLSVVVLTPLP
jgi:hypothetical protein